MRFDLITIFPEFFAGPLNLNRRRAAEAGIVQIHVQDLREFTKDRIAQWTIGRSAAAKAWSQPEPLFHALNHYSAILSATQSGKSVAWKRLRSFCSLPPENVLPKKPPPLLAHDRLFLICADTKA